jgi:hypothetical protein
MQTIVNLTTPILSSNEDKARQLRSTDVWWAIWKLAQSLDDYCHCHDTMKLNDSTNEHQNCQGWLVPPTICLVFSLLEDSTPLSFYT